MNKSLVTETPDELFDKAEKDLISVNVLLSTKYYPEDRMYDIICFHATQAVEKLLKGFIISNGKNIEKTHDLDYLQMVAMAIDNSFSKIKLNCLLLNNFIPNMRYSDANPITKRNIVEIIKSLKMVCNFPMIKTMRDTFSKRHGYEIANIE